ncbi:restriction endonuclease subunit S [Faecalibacterium prausnitzii]|uniref:restriction endonuclease subunit S n=1 Tax=Faecalibacterium prausnitzii TaxID=853 RepID=UPI001CBD8A48|nr:restriction endonuclease subunit S [Faecalibacterium prausnitzii]
MQYTEYELGELLPFEQPTAYIVKSTDYSDAYATPVLTAGKSFILGKTNETDGIFDQLPVIIFDDFTTATQFVNFRFKVKSSAMKILHINTDLVIPKYIFYRLQIIQFDHSTHKRYWIQSYSKIKVLIPPLDEQSRIVTRIDELFSELDKAVDTLKTTKEQLEVYRQAVLKEIFDSVSTTSVHIKDVCLDIKVGIVIKPTQYYVSENGVPAFRNANVRRGYINDTDWVMISKEGHQQNCRSEVHTNDVLISRSGANLGMASVVPARYNGYNAIDVVIAVPDISKVIPEFLAQYTNSPMGRAIVKKNERGAAQGHLNVSAYANLPIGVPDLQEQEKLVKQISDRLSVCDSIEKTVDTALAQADAMRQSILKQAFEGTL